MREGLVESITLPLPQPVKIHELKTVFTPFQDVWLGRKVHEVRFNDRDFCVGDVLILREWKDYRGGEYTGRCIYAEVTYMTRGFGYSPERKVLGENAVVMSIRVLSKVEGHVP